jgi:hypothetical protein
MNRLGVFSILSFLMLMCMSCGKNLPPRPEGMPKLYPCTVTATFGGVPIAGVCVVLFPQTENEKWKPTGITNAEGYAKLSTSYGYPGAPAGTYTVTFSLICEPDEDAPQGTPVISLIPLKYSKDQSKETVEIKPGKNEFSFTLDGGEERLPPPQGNILNKR